MTQKERSARAYRNRKDNGLCPRCGKPLDREGHYCSECLEKVRKYHNENREFYIENHLCTECGKNKVPDRERICPECRAKRQKIRKPLTEDQKTRYREHFRKQQKSLYKERSDAGICTRCGKRKAMPGKKKCGICLAKDAEIHKLKYAERPSIREHRKEHHLCYFCGNPIDLPSRNICSSCLEHFRAIAAEKEHDNKYWRCENKIIFCGETQSKRKIPYDDKLTGTSVYSERGK